MQFRSIHIVTIVVIAAIQFIAVKAKAQNASGAGQQAVALGISNVAEIGFVNSGSIVSLNFDDMNDYTDGLESQEQTIRVRSNKNFNVRVKANTSKFTYTGSAANPNMSVSSVLDIKITNNNTGGSIANGFGAFKNLPTSGKKIINNGTAGDDQTFAVKYKATPGFTYPAGTYTVDIVFTVTQR